MKFILLITLTLFPIIHLFAQIQIGADIDGEAANDESGYQVSMPDENTIAISAMFNGGGGAMSGHVRIYNWTGSSWIQKGSDINGEASNDLAGSSISMPDANTIAIGAKHNDGNGSNSGHVRIYTWSGSSWTQKGSDINGEAANDASGYSVSMPDANTVAIGAPFNAGAGSGSGHVRIFTWSGSAWVQKGVDINGEAANDNSGHSVSMPNANTVAIGAPYNDGGFADAGHVRIFTWSGSAWVQKGIDINGEAGSDFSGWTVSMPDENTVSIGATNNDGGGTNSGHVRIYSWSGSAWVQKGTDINGVAAADECGLAIDMYDANTIAIGSPSNDLGGATSGQVRIFSWNGSAWTQKGVDIYGETVSNYAGCSVSMPNNYTVALGAKTNDDGGTNAGQARVFSLCLSTTGTITISACFNYTSPSGTYVWTTSGTYLDTIPKTLGCDSIITVSLTINSPSTPTGSSSQTFCNSATVADLMATGTSIQWYTAPSGGSALSSGTILTNGVTYYASQTISGCESSSRLAVTVTINSTPTPTGSPSQTFCNSATVADLSATGSSIQWYTTSSGGSALSSATNLIDGITYYASQTVSSCESGTRLAVTVTIVSPSTPAGTPTQIFCDAATVADLNATGSSIQWYATLSGGSPLSSGTSLTNGATYYASQTISGCESSSRLAVIATINSSTASSANASACVSYTWDANGTTYTTSGTYTHILTNSVGCDSVLTLSLIIHPTSTSSQTISSCDSYTWPANGSTYTTSGTYSHTLLNSFSCDSVITLNLTITNTPTANVTLSGFTLTCTNTGVTYQWIDCDNSNLPVSGATLASFTPVNNGNFAVVITNGACSDTSNCTIVTGFGILEANQTSDLFIYPNPTTGEVWISSKSNTESMTVYVYATDGRLLNTYFFAYENNQKITISEPAGLYFLKIINNSIRQTIPIIKQQ